MLGHFHFIFDHIENLIIDVSSVIRWKVGPGIEPIKSHFDCVLSSVDIRNDVEYGYRTIRIKGPTVTLFFSDFDSFSVLF